MGLEGRIRLFPLQLHGSNKLKPVGMCAVRDCREFFMSFSICHAQAVLSYHSKVSFHSYVIGNSQTQKDPP